MRLLFLTLIFLQLNFSASFSSTNIKFDHIDLKLDFRGDILLVKATYTHHLLKSDADSVFFLFDTNYQIDKISCNGYVSHRTIKKAGDSFPYLLIRLDRKNTKEKSVDFKFEYSIDLKKQNHIASDWIELSLDKSWYPCYNSLGTKFTSAIHIEHLPTDYKIFSYPHASIRYNKDESIDIVNQTPWFDILLLAGKSMKQWNNDEKDLTVQFYARQSLPDSVLESMHAKVIDIIQFYNTSFGSVLPLKQLRVVLRNTMRNELGYQFYRPGMVVSGSDFNSYGNLAHEIAHHWWINDDIINGQWLSEGFANYSALLVLDKYDTVRRNTILTNFKTNSEGKGSVLGASLFAPNAFERYYYKAAVVLWSLDQLIGRQKMLKLLSERIRTKADTEQSVLRLVEKIAGKSVADYFLKELNAP